MTTTVTGLFSTRELAADAVREIRAVGIANEEISIVTNDARNQTEHGASPDGTLNNNMAGSGAGDGAAIGGIVGGSAGLLAGLGALTIPGLGPVLGVGWLLTTAIGTAIGASGGGLIGALIGAGVNRDDAQLYVDRVRQGGTLVSARVADENVAAIESIMTKYNGLEDRHVYADGQSIPPTNFVRPTRPHTPAG